MKRYFLFVLIFMLGALTILAQETDKIEYKNLVVEKDGFSLDVPKDFNLESFDEKDDEYRFYAYRSQELYLFIKSSEKKDNSPNKSLIDYAVSNTAIVRQLALKNFEATKYEFLDEEGLYQKIIIVPGKNRNLVFHSVSTTKDNQSVKKFFTSLKFNNVSIPSILSEEFFNDVTNDDKIKIVPIAKPEKKSDKVTGTGSGVGSDSGIGSGRGSGQGSGGGIGSGSRTEQNNTTITKGVTSGLKILSKPRPAYTDMARTYNLQGTVTLRVTFLANGEIGSISIVDKIPFGLTLKAIQAAKLLKFEPAKRNGVSYSVVKAVQFSFTIY